MSSINIFPLLASIIRNRDKHKVDLPLPVRPTTPTFSPGLIVNDISFSMIGVSNRYLFE